MSDTGPIFEMPNGALALERFAKLIGPKRTAHMMDAAVRAKRIAEGRIFWNVNSTGAGGGVAEMLQTLVHYGRGAGVDTRWLVLRGTAPFFAVTKRLHNRLHGFAGDGEPLGAAAHRVYEEALAPVAAALCERIRPGDPVLLHDPQTAGLIPALVRHGAQVAWRCHVGTDDHNAHTDEAWAFLHPWLDQAHAHVFSRLHYVPDGLAGRSVWIIPPSIDPFAVKNRPLAQRQVRGILRAIGILGGMRLPLQASYEHHDGRRGRIERGAVVLREGPAPRVDTPLVVQVSRWDRLKDMPGVMRGFVQATSTTRQGHLALVGPSVEGVEDDPEGAEVHRECVEVWQGLPSPDRRRISLVTLPMDDLEENAAMVNAIQRHASILVQKSLREGFGLTVTEAMWKRRPIIASAVGGIRDQVVDDVHGLLVDDPTDLDTFAAHVHTLLGHRQMGRRLARNAYRRCVTHFLPPRHLTQYVDVLGRLLA